MRARAAVAISTTGDEHRLRFLETCVRHWSMAMRGNDSLFVTVDGDAAAVRRVSEVVAEHTGSVFQVGQTLDNVAGSREGVAVNKNTGLELMMDNTPAEHLFLSDDDTWPKKARALDKHIDLGLAHSMVCWGPSRLVQQGAKYATWSWPRGVMLYVNRHAVQTVGGMDERFGAGGHEHAEYSQRIYNAGITPAPFVSPTSYGAYRAMGADDVWHCEDMRRFGEPRHEHDARRRALTTIKRTGSDWARIHAVMDSREGDSSYVSFRAHDNGRASATLSQNTTSRGADT